MPEIKNTFLKGRMNKDLDERLVPNGEYRDALNIAVSTSEDSNVGTAQTILGNLRAENVISSEYICVGSIANEKTNKLYWFVKNDTIGVDAILEYCSETGNKIGLIPSRRQVEYDGGYVNNWTTETFSKYANKLLA